MLVNAYKLVVLERYAQAEGRAGRAEFWWFVLANFLIGLALNIVAQALAVFFVVSLLYSLALIVPSVCASIRRLHDTSRSGWFLLISLIPLVGFIIVIVLLAQDSTPGPNEYGVTAAGP